MQQRYYDPVIGRFYSNDPVGFTPSNPMMFNRYAYANNNPYKYVDPDGRQSELKFEMPSVQDKVSNMFGFDNAAHANKASEAAQASITKSIDSASNSVNNTVDIAVNEFADRSSVSLQGTAGVGLGVTASAEVDRATAQGDGTKLAASLNGSAYGASASLTANFTFIKPNPNATGPVTATSIMGGPGLGGGLTIQWTPSFGVTGHLGAVKGVSISTTVAGAQTRIGE